jgi:hypothetical protein
VLRLPLLAFIISLGLLSGDSDSAKSRSEGLTDLQAIKKRWDDGMLVAISTARIALYGPAMNQRQIRRDLEGVKPGECQADAKSALVARLETQQHASRVVGDWIWFNNTQRRHQALGV